MKNVALTLIVIIIMAIGCNTSNDIIDDTASAHLRDYTGLDGCGWVIELTDGTTLEPLNLDAFNFTPVDGMAIELTYTEQPMGSICMVGKTVNIITLIVK
jgi:uncharacterized protein YceK